MKSQEIKFKDQNHNYSIFIGNNTLNILPKKIKTLCPKTKKIALVVDTKVPNKFIKFVPGIFSIKKSAFNCEPFRFGCPSFGLHPE